MGNQVDRLAYIEQRDGVAAAHRFARETMVSYRRAVLDGSRYTMYRRKLIQAYLELKGWLRERR